MDIQDFIDKCEAILQDYKNEWFFNDVESMLKAVKESGKIDHIQIKALEAIQIKINKSKNIK